MGGLKMGWKLTDFHIGGQGGSCAISQRNLKIHVMRFFNPELPLWIRPTVAQLWFISSLQLIILSWCRIRDARNIFFPPKFLLLVRTAYLKKQFHEIFLTRPGRELLLDNKKSKYSSNFILYYSSLKGLYENISKFHFSHRMHANHLEKRYTVIIFTIFITYGNNCCCWYWYYGSNFKKY
jgi:hypothetical protein